MRGLADARRAVDVEADEPVTGPLRLAAVEADSHADALLRRPDVADQCALDLECRRCRRCGIVEDAEELVATGVDLATARLFDGAALQLAGLGKHSGVARAESVGKPARVLDVAEEEGERHASFPTVARLPERTGSSARTSVP